MEPTNKEGLIHGVVIREDKDNNKIIKDYYDNGRVQKIGLSCQHIRDGKVIFEVFGYEKEATQDYKFNYCHERVHWNEDGSREIEIIFHNPYIGNSEWIGNPYTWEVLHVKGSQKRYGEMTQSERTKIILYSKAKK